MIVEDKPMCILFVVGDGVGERARRKEIIGLKTCPILQVHKNIRFNPLREQTRNIHCTHESSSIIPVYEIRVNAHYCHTVLIILVCVSALVLN